MNSKNELSNLSYTNKDFNAIYTELLEYAKKISYKWDPSASDESDPGVVLLKLAALIGDKNSYHIDKNILELMPASVTQLPAARQLFEQCGYSMKYYQAATGYVTLTVKKHPQDIQTVLEENSSALISYKVPEFTMFTDVDASIVYTVTPDNELILTNSNQVYSVIEGVATEYTINNDPVITLLNLDNRNRLYFTESNIAENGIFIRNVDTKNYEEWTRVDNLEVTPKGTRCYKFGLTLDNSLCYIEFPEDIEYVFGQGINITYIRTSGNSGNIAKKKLKEFYTDTKFEYLINNVLADVPVSVTSENIYIDNPLAITNGKDPESIDSAYKSYKRVKDTFDTLVTLKDYSDHIVTSEYASNAYVCDRTNDIQHSYKLLEVKDLQNVLKTVVKKDEDDADSMSSFDLCIYALEYVPNVTTSEEFKRTFTLTSSKSYERFLESEQVKSLQHNFLSFDSNKILMIKNKYVLKAHVIPRTKLDIIQQHSLQDNIRTALYSALNSKELVFGEPVSYELIYETINNADDRIKAASVEYPHYETYAVYKDSSNKIQELRIDNGSTKPSQQSDADLWAAFQAEIWAKNVLCGATPLYDDDNMFTHSMTQNTIKVYKDVDTVSTATSVSCEFSNNCWESRELQDNENLLLTVPNLIPEPTYPVFSNYVKFIYDFPSASSNNLSGNTKYTLGTRDFIVFFWKSADTNDYYDYLICDSSSQSCSNIIAPSFVLSKQQSGMKDDIKEIFTASDVQRRGRTDQLLSTIDVNGVDTTVTDYVKSLTKSGQNVLTGTQEIRLFKIHEIHINNPVDGATDLLWILNKSEKDIKGNDVYKIPWSSGGTYTLREGEHLIYTNATKTLLNDLGQGTLLTKTGFPTLTNWEVPCVSYKDIISDIDSIDSWFRISLSNTDKLIAAEQKQLQLGPSTKLKIYGNIDGWINTAARYNITSSPTSLQGCELAYVTSDNIEHAIESYSGNEVYWRVSSILNLKLSPEQPFALQSGQSITIGNKTIEGSDTKYVLSDKNISVVGGTDVSVQVYSSESNSYKNIELLEYALATSSDTNIMIDPYSSVVRAVVAGTDGASSQTITFPTFQVLPGSYLLQFTLSHEPVAFSVTAPTTVTPFYTYANNETKPDVIYLYKYQTSTTTSLSISASVKVALGETLDIHVQPLYRYTADTFSTLDSATQNLVIDKLKTYDIDHKFDYTYVPENYISNPLVPTSFHNSIHAFNKFTIDEWTTGSEGDIVVTSNIR